MPAIQNYKILFAPQVIAHLETIEKKHHKLIRKTIDEQLSFTPERITRNRKPLEEPSPFSSTWELRFGRNQQLRVFYEIDRENQIVHVLAIGVKIRNRLFFGNEEFIS